MVGDTQSTHIGAWKTDGSVVALISVGSRRVLGQGPLFEAVVDASLTLRARSAAEKPLSKRPGSGQPG
jgi:hypothetical protein